MKVQATFTYRKIKGLLSRDMTGTPDFALLIRADDAVKDVLEHLGNILQDARIKDGPVTITIDAGE